MRQKLGVLSALYFVQGLPYGFQLTALPVYLRAEGVSLAGIGLASALALPWAFKVVWGPAVDRFGSRRWGRRRSWILPLQLALFLACAAAAWIQPERGLFWLLATVLAMNLFASTLDVAVDALAIDLLRPEELGYGNVAQVVGYKLGMLTGGGLLVWASAWIGWRGLFLAMAALVAASLVAALVFREPAGDPDRPAPSLGGVLAALWRALRTRGGGWLLLFVATYKLGETMADAMFRPFLVDSGFEAAEIGLWVGTWGMLFSLAGSFAGGALASKMRILHAVALAALLRALAVAGVWWLSLAGATPARVIAVTAAESLFGGALTTALFAYMMLKVDRRIGATHYTALATVEVLGKLAAAWLSGFVAQGTGYPALFGLATVLALAFLGLLVPLRRSERAAGEGLR